jgi:DNA primase
MKTIKSILLEDHNLEKVLEYYSYENINRNTKEIRCARETDSNPTSVRIKLNENLTSQDFAKNIYGDIFTLIMEHKNIEFKNLINEIKSLLNINTQFKKKQIFSFQEIFNKLRGNSNDIILPTTYPETILENYENTWNTRFFNDNISIKIQKKFNIGYDSDSNRITIPWRNQHGELIGIIGRDNTGTKQNKYLALIPFPKSSSLYGFSENYKHLLNADTIYLFESEKSVLQSATYNYYNSLALGGNGLSTYQIREILSLNPKKIILAFDEGIDKEIIKQRMRLLKSNIILKECKVGLIYDKDNKYMKLNSKSSPTDMGKDIFEKIINECIYIS